MQDRTQRVMLGEPREEAHPQAAPEAVSHHGTPQRHPLCHPPVPVRGVPGTRGAHPVQRHQQGHPAQRLCQAHAPLSFRHHMGQATPDNPSVTLFCNPSTYTARQVDGAIPDMHMATTKRYVHTASPAPAEQDSDAHLLGLWRVDAAQCRAELAPDLTGGLGREVAPQAAHQARHVVLVVLADGRAWWCQNRAENSEWKTE